jgi:hypothetical protein
MVRKAWFSSLLVVGLLAVCASPVVADEIDRRIEKLEREVAELREALEAGGQESDSARLAELKRQIDILAAELESLRTGQPAVAADQSEWGMGPAASKIYRTEKGVSIGGYGELFYQNFDSTLDDGSPNDAEDSLDLLRAVLYFGYKFNDKFLFNSEIEFEHSTTGEDGEVSLEFAYVDYLWRDPVNVRAGLLLLPMGFVNELHEPTVFLGSTRPETERRIIPTTWRENGAGIFGDIGPLTYRTYVVNGFDASGFSAAGLRDGRQDGSKAKADDFAWTGRLDYVATPGLVAGASAYVGNSGQGLEDATGSIDAATSILEAHVDWRWKGLELRALGARARVDDVSRLNQELGLTGEMSIGESLVGGYLQAGYDVLVSRPGSARLLPYVRWETLNTQDDVPAGFAADPANDEEILTVGLAYQPIRQLIVKVDLQDIGNEADTGYRQINANLGYVF